MKDKYKTKDLAESGYLLTKGKRLVNIDRQGKICWFVFEDRNDCESLINEFLFGNSTIPAKAFYESIQTLKHKIFA